MFKGNMLTCYSVYEQIKHVDISFNVLICGSVKKYNAFAINTSTATYKVHFLPTTNYTRRSRGVARRPISLTLCTYTYHYRGLILGKDNIIIINTKT